MTTSGIGPIARAGVRPQRLKLAAAAVKDVIQMPLCQVLLGPEVPSRRG
jgi:hypothetical protein